MYVPLPIDETFEIACPLCEINAHGIRFPIPMSPPNTWMTKIECPKCRPYYLAYFGDIETLRSRNLEDRFKVSTFVASYSVRHKGNTPLITFDQINPREDDKHPILINNAIERFPKSLPEIVDQCLLNLASMSKGYGDLFQLKNDSDEVLMYSRASNEMQFFVNYLLEDHLIGASNGHRYPFDGKLTFKGWNRVAELERVPIASKPNQAFVAMWFDSSLDNFYQNGIKLGISLAGYDCRRIDEKPTIEKIDDEILAEIKMSKFIVADFTGSNPGAYYEAGFARGLGKPVISTCRADYLDGKYPEKKVHFDTSHYKHIRWEEDKLEDFAQALKNHIIANLDPGENYKPN